MLSIFSQYTKNPKVGPNWHAKRGPFGISQYPFCRKTSKNEEGTLLGIFCEKKSQPETLKGGPFSLARYGMLRGKKEKLFWFSSLGQIVELEL